MGWLLLLALMYTQHSRDTLHKQDAFRCHQQSTLHIARLLTGTLTLIVSSHKITITIAVQIFKKTLIYCRWLLICQIILHGIYAEV